MQKEDKNTPENKALKTFLVLNKLENGEEHKEFAERAGVAESVLYNLISGRTKKATKLIAKAIVSASNGKLTMKDMGYENE